MAVEFISVLDADGSLVHDPGQWIDPSWFPTAIGKFLVRVNAASRWEKAVSTSGHGGKHILKIETTTGQWKYEVL